MRFLFFKKKLGLLLFLNILMSSRCVYCNIYADWMKNNLEPRANDFLRDIALPGTHDSATHKISMFSGLAPGEPIFYYLVKPMVVQWSKTQSHDVYQQLVGGIRYLDLRIAESVAKITNNHKYVIVHGLVSCTLDEVVYDVLRFARQHPKEVILIKAVTAYSYGKKLKSKTAIKNFERKINEYIKRALKNTYKDYDCDATLNDYWQQGKSVTLLPKKEFHDYWHNTHKLHLLKQKIEDSFHWAPHNKFRVTQLIFTPPADPKLFIHPSYNISFMPNERGLYPFSKPIFAACTQWIKQWKAEGKKLNIIIADFYETFPFVKTVIELNKD